MLTPPTDNYYKFVGVCGLLLFALGVMSPFNKDIWRHMKQSKDDMIKYSTDIEYLQLQEPTAERNRDLSFAKQMLEYRERNYGHWQDRRWFNLVTELAMQVGGLTAMLWGFKRWRDVYQQYDDAKVKREHEAIATKQQEHDVKTPPTFEG